MGGDQVYPVPNAAEYENRMLGPYRAALPCVLGEAPELFAIPGSHDWYDGLVNFISIFCRNHWIGGWKTRQRRSYFAIKLPYGWWLWGIDIQFGSYIDEEQLQYFADVAADQVQPGDRIILCMAKEVESGRKQVEIHSDRHVEYLEREIIQPSGARLLLYLKSGKHYYARYEQEDGCRQHPSSGGGGAFLHPTHNLPERIDLPGAGQAITYRRAGTYPSSAVSKRLRKRMWLLPVDNLPLAGVFGTVQVLLAFMLGLHLGDRHVGTRPRRLASRAVGEPHVLPSHPAHDRVFGWDGALRPRCQRRRPRDTGDGPFDVATCGRGRGHDRRVLAVVCLRASGRVVLGRLP
ncbi:MAG: hypothetical protein QOJ58_4658 [Alphaproteobacteria bacterium]|jgi:hypothetical protein|nr:hypothetical protein [Alphaproteobacteria bacterium]